jgi:hypothetical protein
MAVVTPVVALTVALADAPQAAEDYEVLIKMTL